MAETSIRSSAGARLRQAWNDERPLQLVGAINSLAALQAEKAGFRALYLSGAGVANASFGLPDLALTTLTEVIEDARRITSRTDLPLLVDADTGWGAAHMIARVIREMIRAGVAGVHIEDQVQAKRCGHRPGKALVSTSEMVDRIRSAVDARVDPQFVIMARTDAHAVEGLESAIERSQRYVEAGADALFAEALTDIEHFRAFTRQVSVPVLANMTEFGKTPLYGLEQLRDAGVRIALYPLSAFRAMYKASEQLYQTLRRHGTQSSLLSTMQTRAELYQLIDYHAYEEKLDALFRRSDEEPT